MSRVRVTLPDLDRSDTAHENTGHRKERLNNVIYARLTAVAEMSCFVIVVIYQQGTNILGSEDELSTHTILTRQMGQTEEQACKSAGMKQHKPKSGSRSLGFCNKSSLSADIAMSPLSGAYLMADDWCASPDIEP